MGIVSFSRIAVRRVSARVGTALALSALLVGCSSARKEAPRETPLPAGAGASDLYSVAKVAPPRPAEIVPLKAEKHDILILSGGGAHAAYQGGVICGWHDAGTMPEFSVVTGVSAGALLAAAVFAGGEYLPEIRRLYTELSQTSLLRGDLWMKKRHYGLGTDSIATTDKLRGHLRRVLNDPGYFEKVAAEHAKGRRLYVGTTNLDTQRFVPWDMGAIASEGTPESRKLFEDIVVASCAIPPLLAPSRICTTIDGKPFEEMHVDGFVTRNLFFYPPSDWPGEAADAAAGHKLLAGTRVYVVLAGKVWNDAEATRPSLGDVTLHSFEAIRASSQRGGLARIYGHCLARGMTLKIAAIPAEYPALFSPLEFDRAKMSKLFCEGYTRARADRIWNLESPERSVSEERARRSTVLTTTPTDEIGPLLPRRLTPSVR